MAQSRSFRGGKVARPLLALAAGAAGGVISFFATGNPELGAKIGYAAGGTLGRLLFPGKEGESKEKPGEKRVTASTFGVPIPRVYGRFKVEGNIIWSTEIEPYNQIGTPSAPLPQGVPHATSPQSPAEPIWVVSLAVGICKGPISDVRRIYANKLLILDRDSTGFSSVPHYEDRIRVYKGTETQLPDPLIESVEGEGEVPAFRGLAYVVIEDLPLYLFGNEVPTFDFEVISTATSAFLTQSVSVSPLPEDDLFPSKLGTHLWALEGGTLLRINRGQTPSAGGQFPVQTLVRNKTGDAGATIFGKLVLEDLGDPVVYLLCKSGAGDGEKSFIASFSPAGAVLSGLLGSTSGGVSTNYVARIGGVAEVEGIAIGKFLYTADEGARIRCYRTDTLGRQWTAVTTPHASAKPGNFTVDMQGNLWLISYLDADNAKFFLTKASQQGVVRHFEVSDFGRCKNIAYHIGQNRLLVGGGEGTLGRLSITSTGVLAAGSVAGVSGELTRSMWVSQRRLFGNRLWVSHNNTISEVDINASIMSTLQSIPHTSFGSPVLSGLAYDSASESIWTRHSDSELRVLYVNRLTPSVVTLGQVVSDLCQAAGLSPADLDVSLLTQEVRGYAVLNEETASEALEPILLAYLVDARETSGKLSFVPRGGASLATIPEEDLGAADDPGEAVDLVTWSLAEVDTLPRKVEVIYRSLDRDYNEASQKEERRRDIVPSEEEINLSLPLVLSDTEALKLAENLLYSSWLESSALSFSALPRWEILDPGDVVTVSDAGETYQVRITKATLGANGRPQFSAVLDDQGAVGSVAIGSSPSPYQIKAEILPLSKSRILDVPIVQDGHNDAGLYLPTSPFSAGTWRGAVYYQSADSATYSALLTQTVEAIDGLAETALPAGETTIFDEVSTVDIRLDTGSLSSSTEEDLLADRLLNLAILGAEWLQFRDVTDLGGGVFRLSGLLRGRFGTEHEVGGHSVGDDFVLYSEASFKRLVLDASQIGVSRTVTVATIGAPPAGSPLTTITTQGIGLRPYSPVHFKGQIYVSDDVFINWDFAWQRRSRVGAFGFDTPPVGEDPEAYEVDILDGPGGQVVRTIPAGPPLSEEGVTLTFFGATQKIERSSGLWSDSFFINQYIDISGTGSNDGRYRIVTYDFLDEATIIVDNGPLVVNEGPTANCSISAVTLGARYTENQQDDDFGTFQTEIFAKVYQLSAEFGRGIGTEEHFIFGGPI